MYIFCVETPEGQYHHIISSSMWRACVVAHRLDGERFDLNEYLVISTEKRAASADTDTTHALNSATKSNNIIPDKPDLCKGVSAP